jgi:CHAT domain-containing protein
MRDKELLTIGRLLERQGSLGRPQLVVLSACETGLYDIGRNPDEFVGLPATFMQVGAAGVLGSLWLVDDLATSLLMAKFYDLHLGGGGLEPPSAAAGPGLAARCDQGRAADLYRKHGRQGPARCNTARRSPQCVDHAWPVAWHSVRRHLASAAVTGWPRRERGRSGSPAFHDPYYWAGFVYTGL